MSKARTYRDYLADMVEALNDLEDFTRGMSREEFFLDRKTVNAVIRSLEVLGEAAGKIPPDVRAAHPDLPWQNMIGLRNRLIHEYFGVDLDILWQTLVDDIPPLRPLLAEIPLDAGET
jgi:uncharacterized protein with HEPN domain